jgi:hypothetical protein
VDYLQTHPGQIEPAIMRAAAHAGFPQLTREAIRTYLHESRRFSWERVGTDKLWFAMSRNKRLWRKHVAEESADG